MPGSIGTTYPNLRSDDRIVAVGRVCVEGGGGKSHERPRRPGKRPQQDPVYGSDWAGTVIPHLGHGPQDRLDVGGFSHAYARCVPTAVRSKKTSCCRTWSCRVETDGSESSRVEQTGTSSADVKFLLRHMDEEMRW